MVDGTPTPRGPRPVWIDSHYGQSKEITIILLRPSLSLITWSLQRRKVHAHYAKIELIKRLPDAGGAGLVAVPSMIVMNAN